jgi:thiosulfate/3-mercaptopyruvate sulfurtransferase
VSPRETVLIDPHDLRRRIAAGDCPALLDVRWRLDQPDGRAAYLAGHLPGAVYVSLEQELSDHTRGSLGRHPLPTGEVIQAAARRWGIRQGQSVVVYDDWNRAGSCRAWWVLTAAGLTDVRILDGGLTGWTAAGGDLQTGPVQVRDGDVAVCHPDLYAGARPTLTAADVEASQVATLLDARAPERFHGEVEPVDPVAGHIPGARNLPSTSMLDADGRFLPQAELAALVQGVDRASVGVYCGSGVTASVVLAGLVALGVDAALFPGSWSQWSAEGRRAQHGH